MLIYGGHDYYDCALSMGIDPTVILMRAKSRSIDAEKAGGSLLGRRLEIKSFSAGFAIRHVAVAFCGKVYRGVLGVRNLEKAECIWSADKVRAWIAPSKNTSINVHTNWRDAKMTLEEYFSPIVASNELREYMIANKVSILVEEESPRSGVPCFFVNPYTLKQIGFMKALDPYTAFQELSMWIGGVLGGSSPEIVRITDDVVLSENHGFDKHSFRSSSRMA